MNMPIAILNRRRRGGAASAPAFSPSALFALAEPGVWYDPSDVANLAWRRNLLTWTEQFDNAVWTKSSGSFTSTTETSPIGTATADVLTQSSGVTSAALFYINNTYPSTPASTTLTFSIYAKRGTKDFLVVGTDATAAAGSNSYSYFNLSNGTLGTAASGHTLSITSAGSGWYRCTLTATSRASVQNTTYYVGHADTNGSLTVVGSGSTSFWGAQLELGSTATEYQRITDVNTEVIERFPNNTLFQDTAGTTPVTTPGQTVALALDKSKGLVLGPELVTNGDFSAGSTGWTVGAGWTISGGQASVVGTTALSQSIAGAPRTIRVQFDIVAISGSIAANYGQTNGSFNSQGPIYNTTGTKVAYIHINPSATTGLMQVFFSTFSAGQTATIDNISVKELPGFHATQATTASRPIYGINPVGGRRNLLTRTEEFDNAYWTKTAVTVSANTSATTDPVGGNTADVASETTNTAFHFVELQTAISFAATQYTFTAHLKQGTQRYAGIHINDGTARGCSIDLQTGTLGTPYGSATASRVVLANGWYRLTVTATVSATASGQVAIYMSNSNSLAAYAGNTANNIYVWGAQLETGSTATSYQRVSSIYDVTEAGVASVSYLAFDGVDDGMVTPTITPGIDKAQVFAGVRKLSDAAIGAVVESSTNAGANDGAFAMFAPINTGASGNYQVQSRFSTAIGSRAASYAQLAPDTSVLTGVVDGSGDYIALRTNGTLRQATTLDFGTGNYLAYPLYIGRRGGTTLPFNGQLYSLVVRFGANLDAATISNTETWVAGKTGVTL